MASLHSACNLKLMNRVAFQIVSLYICMQDAVAQKSSREVRQVGDTIFLHHAWRNSHVVDARWRMSDKRLGTIHKNCQDKCQVFANGSLLLKRATKSDTGNYTGELYDHSGRFISRTEIEVIIMEPVSQPEIRASCMVDGQVMLTCSVDRGDEVKLQWTGLGNLSQQLQSERTLYLVSNAFVHMACVAENPVSKKSSKPITKKCRVCSIAFMKLYKKPIKNSEEEEYTDMQFKTAAKDVGDEGNHSTFSDEEILTGQTAEADGLNIAMTNIMQPTESSTFRMNQTLSEATSQGCGPYPLQTEWSSDVVYAQIYFMKRVKGTPGK
ncbi:hypothetical protein AAFF_G00319340 [Aldrovandia affinis]|uniref:Ig-like domain-containing protein n=1 Tax=Aldrovandia affinis TaxID=143900 RepID=A0AAD7WQ98_9TELE|nr:hypothetical protein AAFF_G00319340 [Aldrovandia affinis]